MTRTELLAVVTAILLGPRHYRTWEDAAADAHEVLAAVETCEKRRIANPRKSRATKEDS